MTVDIRSRTSWGARQQDGDLTLSGLALEVFAHHTVTTQLSPSASVSSEEAEMRKVEAIGQSRFGTGISYNVIIFPSGRAYRGVSWNRRGTHTGGRNSTTRSICFAGNYETNKPTAAQLATAAAIFAEGKGKWWKTTAPLRGHRDLKSTACPGKNVYSQLSAIRAGRITSAPTGGFMSDLTEAQQKDVLKATTERVFDPATKTWDSQADAQRKTNILLRRVLARQVTDQALPVDVDVDADAVAEALVEKLPKPLAQAVADALATRLAK